MDTTSLVYFLLFSTVAGDLEFIHRSTEHLMMSLKHARHALYGQDFSQIPGKRDLSGLKFDVDFYLSLKDKWSYGISGHPIYCHRAIRQLYELRERLNSTKDILSQAQDLTKLPARHDYLGSIDGIIRLQDTYKLKVEDLAKGVIAGQQSVQLTHEEKQDMAYRAESMGYFEISVAWLNYMLRRMKDTSTRINLLYHKAKSEFAMGQKHMAERTLADIFALDERNPNALRFKNYIDKNEPKERKPPKWNNFLKRACRGEFSQELTAKKLTARPVCDLYDNNRHPLLLLCPVHREHVANQIEGYIYRDFLSSRECEMLKRSAAEKLSVSTVGGKRSDKDGRSTQVPSNHRISKGVFLRPTQFSKKLQARISAVTDLNSKAFERLQVVNYGIGGYYNDHHDFYPNTDFKKDNRIATFLMYLSDVEAGGATVFPKIRLRMEPKMGDGIFWYNLLKNGRGNSDTLHMACPVLLGSKWVVNEWILRNHNEFTRKCSLFKDE